MTRAQIQARRIQMAAAANDWDAMGLWRALQDAGYEIEYDKVRRAKAGERIRELEYDVCLWIAKVTGFSVEWIIGESDELPDWVAKNRLLVFPMGLTTHQVFADAA